MAMATLTMVPTGDVDASGTGVFRPTVEIPESGTAQWTEEAMAERFHVDETPTVRTDHITIRPVKIVYTGVNVDGSPAQREDDVFVHTGKVYVPFDTDGTTKDGKVMDPYALTFRPENDAGNDAFEGFCNAADAWAKKWVYENNPDKPNGGKYFDEPPKEMNPVVADALVKKAVRSTFYTDPRKINDKTGNPWPANGSARLWRSGADTTFVGEDGASFVEARDAHAKGNTVFMTLRLEGIVCGETTISLRWVICKGMVINRGQRFETPVPSCYAQYATAAPKATADTTMADGAGGVAAGFSTF